MILYPQRVAASTELRICEFPKYPLYDKNKAKNNPCLHIQVGPVLPAKILDKK
jgi:hypothetical protein